ncbi:MAG: helix-turn-helix transcriptional regulator [Glaciecola sp.]
MNIQQRRMAKGWTQEDLARHSGLSTRTIQRIESGQSIGLESQKCIAAVFDVSTNTLMQDKPMNDHENQEPSKFLKKEQEAIKFAQLIFKGPQKGQKDQLLEVERKAINQVKAFIKKL